MGPVVMSALALLIVLVVFTTGWERGLKDEGAAAHLWQLLVVFQLPLVLAFLTTADWRRPFQVGRILALQAAALALAFAPVALLRL